MLSIVDLRETPIKSRVEKNPKQTVFPCPRLPRGPRGILPSLAQLLWNCKGETPTGGASLGHLSGCFLEHHPQTTFSQTAAILRRGWHHTDQAVGKADASELHCPYRTGELHSRAQLWCLMRGSPPLGDRLSHAQAPPTPRPAAEAVIPGSLLSL